MSAGQVIYRSPTEHHPAFSTLPTSNIPEQYGADFYWITKARGKCGVQRKEWKDLFASVRDGRLSKELGQMGALGWRGLVIEGELRVINGRVMNGGEKWDGWTEGGVIGFIENLQDQGVHVHRSTSAANTLMVVQSLAAWTRKETHSGFLGRKKLPGYKWGHAGNREYAIHLMTGLHGVGEGTAEKIWDRYGLPITWTVTVEQLMEIGGIGEKKARQMIEGLNHAE